MGAVRLEEGAWVGDVDELTPGEWMRVLLGLCDSVSDVVVGVVKEFLNGVWRVRSGGLGYREAGLGQIVASGDLSSSPLGVERMGLVRCHARA